MTTNLAPIDIAIIGAGAAGMTAAIFAAEEARGEGRRVVLFDGAKTLGAKILVSGGGRCNVTNREVTAADYNGGSPSVIRNVLRAFDNKRTLAWMEELGVALKLEPTGKYFPVSDKARTVLDALVHRARELGVEIRHPWRMESLRPGAAPEDGFDITFQDHGTLRARRVLLATGGLALPKSGSDGHGLSLAESLGHRMIPTTPALVPLLLKPSPELNAAELSGLTLDARLSYRTGAGKESFATTASFLFTHFGASGPSVLDVSRHWLRARLEGDHGAAILFSHPTFSKGAEEADRWLQAQAAANPRQHAATAVGQLFPERLARTLAPEGAVLAQLPRAERRALAQRIGAFVLPVVGDRGYTFAETTAGGVDLTEVDYRTMASRRVNGLYLCGEMLDVDGRIGGFNFQWAWASGYLAGRGMARSLNEKPLAPLTPSAIQ